MSIDPTTRPPEWGLDRVELAGDVEAASESAERGLAATTVRRGPYGGLQEVGS